MQISDSRGGWERPPRYRDPFSRIAAAIATLLIYLPLFFLALTRPLLLSAPAVAPPRTIETIMQLLPRPQPSVPPKPDFTARPIRPKAVNAPAPQHVIVPARRLAPPALLPVTVAELSPLAGGALPGLGSGAVSGTGTGGNGAAPAACVDPAYLAAITHHIGHFFHYPAEAARTHTTGIVYVRFTVDKNGRSSALAVQSGSGHPLLDTYVLALIREASPLPPIPGRMHIDQINVLFPVMFTLPGEAQPKIRSGGQIAACN